MNSREKGKSGERELAAFLTERGFPARRGQQYHGGPDSPDVICPSLPDIHLEGKLTNRLRLAEAYKQAEAEAAPGQVPIVAHRANRGIWMASLRLADLLDILRDSDRHCPPEEP